MEADWEYEIGGGAPKIDAGWAGFVNLVRRPERVSEIAETAQLPALAAALAGLNGAASPVWSAKCDVWPELEPGTYDPDEMEAAAGAEACGAGGYVDLLARDAGRWEEPEAAARDCRALCARLRAVEARNCRVDLVIREARFDAEREGLGLTAYVTACGADAAAARRALGRALEALAATFAAGFDPVEAHSPVQ